MAPLAKSEIEFTPVQDSNGIFRSHTTTAHHSDGTFTNDKTFTLSQNPTTGNKTVLAEHAPGSVWGGSPINKDAVCSHEYWQECYIIEGRLYDMAKKQWFSAGSYCCRPPGMLQGPYKTDEMVGCRVICMARYVQK